MDHNGSLWSSACYIVAFLFALSAPFVHSPLTQPASLRKNPRNIPAGSFKPQRGMGVNGRIPHLMPTMASDCKDEGGSQNSNQSQ